MTGLGGVKKLEFSVNSYIHTHAHTCHTHTHMPHTHTHTHTCMHTYTHTPMHRTYSRACSNFDTLASVTTCNGYILIKISKAFKTLLPTLHPV